MLCVLEDACLDVLDGRRVVMTGTTLTDYQLRMLKLGCVHSLADDRVAHIVDWNHIDDFVRVSIDDMHKAACAPEDDSATSCQSVCPAWSWLLV